MKQRLSSLFLFLFILGNVMAQNFDLNFEVAGHGYLADDEDLPFWMVNNRDGAVSEATSVLANISGYGHYRLNENSKFSAGASIYARDGVADEIQRKELYFKYTHKWIKATLGSESVTQKMQGLSTVNDNFLLSGNSRPLPGIIIEANNPIPLLKNIYVDWGIAHYELNDDRYVPDTRVHYKRLSAAWRFTEHSAFKFEIQHYAQWAGNSPELGQQPDDLEAFWKVFLAKRGNEDDALTDILNAVGNHLGFYNFEYIYRKSKNIYKFYHQHPFEDGSGTGFRNFPDGIWGFYFEPNSTDFTTFFRGVLLEYVQTTNQSGATGGSGRDNYFNSGVYRSGWSYEQNIIGLPFITLAPSGLRIDNNRIRAIHIGLTAAHKRWTFKSKVSFVENIGNFEVEIDPSEKAIYSYLDTGYDLYELGKLNLLVGFDYSDLKKDRYGVGIIYTYSF